MFAATGTAYSALMDAPVASAGGVTGTPITRVFVVEDSEPIRARLLSMLGAMSRLEVVGYADTAPDAIAAILAARPDVVVLDIKLKAGSGIEVLQAIKRSLRDVAVIMLTNHATEAYREKCLQAGAEHFLDKTNEFEQLVPIINQLKTRQQ
jgi:two-component system response regulator DevR